MKNVVYGLAAAVATVAIVATPSFAAVTQLPAGDTLVTNTYDTGEFAFYDHSWGSTSRFDPVVNAQSGAIGLTYNDSDGLLYGVNSWTNQAEQQVYSVNPTTGASETWDLEYGSGGTTDYETRSLAFDGDGNLFVLTCSDVVDCNTSSKLFPITLNDDGSSTAGTPISIDYSAGDLSSVAWDPTTETFYALSYQPNEMLKLNADGTVAHIFDVEDASLSSNETTDLAFDSAGHAWINYGYGDALLSYDLSDANSITKVIDGDGFEGLTIIRAPKLAETGVDAGSAYVLVASALAMLASGAWFARRRRF